MKLHPVLIAVEGIDGAGKSTQIPRIAQWFQNHGQTVHVSCEPTHGPIGMKIRTAPVRLDPKTERQLFMDDRKEHIDTCLLPALKQGNIAITDRYFYSSMAYQGTRLDAFDHAPSQQELEALQDEIHQQHKAFAPESDILIYIRLDVDTALARMRASREELDPFENRQNLERVARAFERIAENHPCVITADASLPPDLVTQQLYEKLNALFGF